MWSGRPRPLPLTSLGEGTGKQMRTGMCMRAGKGMASAVPPFATQDAGFSP
jgi:hypothetical protein